MRHSEEGSSLLTVMAAILIMTVMMTGLLSISTMSIRATLGYGDQTRALANARSGMLAVYQQMQDQWKKVASTGITNLSAAEAIMQNFVDTSSGLTINGVQIWSKGDNSLPFQVTVAPGTNNFSEVNVDGTSTASNLYQNYNVTVTGISNGMKQTLYDTFQISGVIDAFNYAIYTPENLIICGAPEIDGSVSVGSRIYIDSEPWSGHVIGTDDIEAPISKWYREPGGYEPFVLPKFAPGSSLLSSGAYSFTMFHNSSDQAPSPSYGPISDADFLNVQQIADPKPISPQPEGQNPLENYIDGSPTIGESTTLLENDYVTQAVESADAKYKPAAEKNIPWLPGYLPPDGGYIELTDSKGNMKTFDFSGTEHFTGDRPLYIDGNLTIEKNAHMTLSQPLFVSGNLIVKGYLDSSSAVYVRGSTAIFNVPSDNGEGKSNYRRLLITGIGQIEVEMATTDPVNHPASFDAFLMTAGNLRLVGMAGYYRIIGGVAAQNIELDSTVGKQQYIAGDGNLRSKNLDDLTPRLQITYDPTYAKWPVNGTPTLRNPILQPMPQPATTKPADWP